MQIFVKLSSAFIQYSPTNSLNFSINVEDGTTTQNLVYQMGVPLEVSWLSFVNGLHAEKDTLLNEGDKVTILPITGGG